MPSDPSTRTSGHPACKRIAAVLGGCFVLSGCSTMDVQRAAYQMLRQEDCRLNELESFCRRTYANEFHEYDHLRRAFMRESREDVWRVGTAPVRFPVRGLLSDEPEGGGTSGDSAAESRGVVAAEAAVAALAQAGASTLRAAASTLAPALRAAATVSGRGAPANAASDASRP